MRIQPRLRTTLAAAFTATTVAASLLLFPAAAQALTIDIVCVGIEEATFDPGLTLTAQTIHFTDTIDYIECVSTSAPSITSAAHDLEADFEASCLTVLSGGSGQRVIVWNTTETSTFTFDYVFSQIGGQAVVVETGIITAGKFNGSDAIQTLTGGSINLLNCLGSGVTDNTTAVTLTISH